MSRLKIALISLISLVFQFALAILGWGGFAPFFRHPAFVALTVVTLAAMCVAPFSSGNISSGVKEDRGNRWVLFAFSLIAILIAYLPALTDRLGILTLDGEAMRWTGVVLFTAGCVLRMWPVFVLGSRFSGLAAIQPGHTLETGGIYSVVRNPSYLGMLASTLGWALTFRSVIGVALTALLLVPLIARMKAEERLLGAQFGAEYDAYCARTRRLIPGIY